MTHPPPIPHDISIAVQIAERVPASTYADGLAALADAALLQMFDSDLGEALRFAYTTIRQHQEHESRQTQLSAATDGLRAYLARLDSETEQL